MREWQINHYTQRLSESKSYKEKQFLTQTLNGLKSNPDDNTTNHLPPYQLRYPIPSIQEAKFYTT